MNPDINTLPPRLRREYKTIVAMMKIYCHDHHGASNALCSECQELQDYAFLRLERCPFQEDKTTCANCPIHCYRRDMKERIREVMRYAGPRMMYRHPILAIRHLLDGRKKAVEPVGKKRKRAASES
ncbi:MAG: nitrous oxide-stimulated promoter family protein [Chloroflexi bacterium]|nr:nitrous oxide-stimulated promoter family protein [Chloroflexota bacterium]